MKETRIQMAISDLKYVVNKSEEATVHSNAIGERRYNILQNCPFSERPIKRKSLEFLDLKDPTAPLFDNNSSKKPCYRKDVDEKEESYETIEDVLARQIDNEEEIELTNEDFEQKLNDADIVNISADNDNSLINKKLFNELKEAAQSQSLRRINVNGLKEWIKKNYTVRKISVVVSLIYHLVYRYSNFTFSANQD
ncbi:hypothetical protein C2G38_1470869 [Gigaspora rosea]|uniref:Uncharacterized protein n=1 Tax=Gigaspora rosea TaxID=44941 RepID=A0A397W362_9GLOM|nr:hypothetical protein C2G38_1470869 [Gigaspora rosea]